MEPRPWHAHYDPGVPPSLDYRQLALPDFLRRSAEQHPRAPALVFANLRLTYAELLQEVECCAAAMAALGAEPGVAPITIAYLDDAAHWLSSPA